jgi:hypothetical protein
MVTHVKKLCDHARAGGHRFSGEPVSLKMAGKASLIGVVVLHLCSKVANNARNCRFTGARIGLFPLVC